MLLTIVMAAHADRVGILPRIATHINMQIGQSNQVEFLVLMDNGARTTGRKMNILNQMAQGRWVATVADDDDVEDDYVESLVSALEEHPDVDLVSFDHTYIVNGEHRALVTVGTEHKKEFHNWETGIQTRYPSALCAIKSEIVQAYEYPDLSDKENLAFISYLRALNPTEHKIGRVLYHHLWNTANEQWRRDVAMRWGRPV